MANQIVLLEDIFTNDQIKEATAFVVQSINGDELQYDTFNATLEFGKIVGTKFVPKGSTGLLTSDLKQFFCMPRFEILVTDPTKYRYGTETKVFHNNELIGKFYMTGIKRVGRTKFSISCVSSVGILSNSQHYGGFYQGESVLEVVKSIINGKGTIVNPDNSVEITGGVVTCFISPDLIDIPVFGCLPVATRRENLHQVLFAIGASASKNENGELFLTPLSTSTYNTIPDERVFERGSVKYPEEVKTVTVYEHNFTSSEFSETVTLFEGQISSEPVVSPITGNLIDGGGSIVLFEEPVDPNSLVATRTIIKEKGVNYAILSPTSDGVLTGKKYAHSIRQVTRNAKAKLGDFEEKENKIVVPNAWLVSFANSELVADRLNSYYSSAKTVTSDIEVKTEKPGNAVEITDAFGDATTGIIKSMDVSLSGNIRAKTEIIADYEPPDPGNQYQYVDEITDNMIWTVPPDVDKIRIVLIGGGQGGASGGQGEPGTEGEEFGNAGSGGTGGYNAGDGGKGGIVGPGGHGGNIHIVTAAVTPGQSFQVKIGYGGYGGTCSSTTPTEGYTGQDSSFGNHSSSSGVPSRLGYFDLLNKKTYATSGKPGKYEGGYGVGINHPDGSNVVVNGIVYKPGKDGKDVSAKSSRYDYEVTIYGGLGGGPAASTNGPNGEQGWIREQVTGVNVYSELAPGANGANATLLGENASVLGGGGSGGNGGGGGAGSGAGRHRRTSGISHFRTGGSGGLGSRGGNGGKGCVLVYY